MTWNQPEVHDVWRQWRSVVDEYPDTMLVGEVCLADPEGPNLAAASLVVLGYLAWTAEELGVEVRVAGRGHDGSTFRGGREGDAPP